MTSVFIGYMVAWMLACVAALVLSVRRRRELAICSRPYWRFLGRPWKLSTFACAASGMTLMAPYTGDPTWDYVDAAFMSAFTFVSAPWVVGVLYLAARGRSSVVEVYVALCCWMFSASWSYDGYLVLRDGGYPITWLANIFASSVLYLLGGMFWNLDWRTGRGLIFAFMADDWPSAGPEAGFYKVLWVAVPIMIFVAAMILPFLWG